MFYLNYLNMTIAIGMQCKNTAFWYTLLAGFSLLLYTVIKLLGDILSLHFIQKNDLNTDLWS